jgi:hypothetical protein
MRLYTVLTWCFAPMSDKAKVVGETEGMLDKVEKSRCFRQVQVGVQKEQ